ncbi:MAG: helix-turn-helix transcriptional regulator [Coriobacteriaceae bacterium]|nr:helix-turn-helix transcriptional regulator [Coriobacteriaceae bacterium]
MAGAAKPYAGERPLSVNVGFTLALIFACFTLASTSYLAWLYRIIELAPTAPSDVITMVGGYSFQAVGIAAACALMRARPDFAGQIPFITAIAIHFACAAATILASTPEALVALGFAMNFLYGIVCAFYLHRLARWVPRNRRGIALGAGYACSIVTTWAMTALQNGTPLAPTDSIIACAVLSLVAIGIAAYPHSALQPGAMPTGTAASANGIIAPPSDGNAGGTAHSAASILSIACFTVLLLSLVKNVGFGFPSADLLEGVSLESSRLFYAAGLIIAGIIADTKRKYAALCCIAALVFPFACLALSNEPVSGSILWAADYLFYGFFTVYRIVLFCDLAESSQREHLAGFGQLFGRIGDAAGTAICFSLADSTIALVAVAAVLFAATVFAFYQLFVRLYPTHTTIHKTPEERLAMFAARYDLSIRERDVLRLVVDGRTNAEAASELFIVESTVKYHVHNLLKKTDCTSRRELIAKYHREADDAR